MHGNEGEEKETLGVFFHFLILWLLIALRAFVYTFIKGLLRADCIPATGRDRKTQGSKQIPYPEEVSSLVDGARNKKSEMRNRAGDYNTMNPGWVWGNYFCSDNQGSLGPKWQEEIGKANVRELQAMTLRQGIVWHVIGRERPVKRKRAEFGEVRNVDQTEPHATALYAREGM